MAENSCCKPPGVPLTAADVHAAPGWAAIEDWARSKADLVDSLYLLGSRMRRDHVDDSDLDIAMVGGPWTNASLSSLPSELGGACMGWIPLKREWFHPPPQVTGIPWVLMGQGVRLWGRPLPERPRGFATKAQMNTRDAYNNPNQAVKYLDYATRAIAFAFERGDSGELLFSDSARYYGDAAYDSTVAAGFACKAALAARAVEPRRAHSVDTLCAVLAGQDPSDPLLAVLRPLHGDWMHSPMTILDEFDSSEPPQRSESRITSAKDAVATIVTEIESRRDDRPTKPLFLVALNSVRRNIDRIQEGRIRTASRSAFRAMEAAIRSVRPLRSAESLRRLQDGGA